MLQTCAQPLATLTPTGERASDPHPLEKASLAVVLTAARRVELMTPRIMGPRIADHRGNFEGTITQQNAAYEFGAEIAPAVVLAGVDQIPFGRRGLRRTNFMSNQLLTT
jgi:hypothetical protein